MLFNSGELKHDQPANELVVIEGSLRKQLGAIIPNIKRASTADGRSPPDWLIDRYQMKTDAVSGIVSAPNAHSDDPMYIANLVRRLVTVSVDNMKTVDSLTPISEKDCYYLDFPKAWRVQERQKIREKEEDRQMVIRSVTQADKELVMGLRAQVSDIAAAYKGEPDFVDYSWEQDLTSTTEKLLLAFNGTTFIGMGTLQNLDGSYVEIGVDIVPEYQHQGLGTTLTALLLDYCREHYPDREIRMRARKENTASL